MLHKFEILAVLSPVPMAVAPNKTLIPMRDPKNRAKKPSRTNTNRIKLAIKIF